MPAVVTELLENSPFDRKWGSVLPVKQPRMVGGVVAMFVFEVGMVPMSIDTCKGR